MNVRRILTLGLCGMAATGCASMPKLKALVTAPQQAELAPSATGPIGHRLDEMTAMNGPPTQQWDMPDGRKAYQWQASSLSATVGPSKRGEIKSAGVSQTTCFYTVYGRADAKGVVKIVGAEEPRPGCMTLAMLGQSK